MGLENGAPSLGGWEEETRYRSRIVAVSLIVTRVPPKNTKDNAQSKKRNAEFAVDKRGDSFCTFVLEDLAFAEASSCARICLCDT